MFDIAFDIFGAFICMISMLLSYAQTSTDDCMRTIAILKDCHVYELYVAHKLIPFYWLRFVTPAALQLYLLELFCEDTVAYFAENFYLLYLGYTLTFICYKVSGV